MVWLKIHDSHLTCKVVNKCLNVCKWVEVAEWNKKMVPSLLLLSRQLPVSVKEDPDSKKKNKKTKKQTIKLLLLLIIFSLTLLNNPSLFRKDFFSASALPCLLSFNSLTNWLCSSSTSSNDIRPSCISLKMSNEYLLNYNAFPFLLHILDCLIWYYFVIALFLLFYQ